MPRPLTGRIVERELASGTTAYYAVVRDVYQLLGYSPHWSYPRAATELRERIIPRVKLGEDWRAPYRVPESLAAPDAFDPRRLTFHRVATDFLKLLEDDKDNPNTINATASPVRKHLLPFFGYHDADRTRAITLVEIRDGYMLGDSKRFLVDDFKVAKKRERTRLVTIRSKLAAGQTMNDLEEFEQVLLRRYGQQARRKCDSPDQPDQPEERDQADQPRSGRWFLSSKGLSNNEINRCLRRLDDIFRFASRRYGYDFDQPGKGNLLTADKPNRDWLRPHHVQAILDAAEQLDREAARYDRLGRREAMATLALAGPRVSELGGIRVRDVDIAGRKLHIPDSKTGAGERDILMSDFLTAALQARIARLRLKGEDWLFATDTGQRRDRNSVRGRLLHPTLDRARELLAERRQPPLPKRVTCHTFRRTFLTYLAWIEKPTRYAMKQAGHKDAKLTLEIYQQGVDDDLDPRVTAWLARPKPEEGSAPLRDAA
jgi:integrase